MVGIEGRREDSGTPGWLKLLRMDVADLGSLCNSAIAEPLLVVEHLHGGTIDCPHCGYGHQPTLGQLKCDHCRRKFTWKTGTPFASSTLSVSSLPLLLLGLQLKQPTNVVAAWTGLSPSAVRWWRRKVAEIRTAYEVEDV